MSRLTKKLKPPYKQVLGQDYVYTSETRLTPSFASVEQKLGQLEDIEEELGIDLITFVKATTQPALYIKNIPFSNEIKLAILTFIHKNDINDNKDYLVWFEVNKEERYLFKLKDYGKTWALTKEELL